MRNKWVIWCGLNAEQDRLEELFGKECVSIRGVTPDDEKIRLERLWRTTDIPIIISKPKIFGFGMNWQVCDNEAFIGLSDSFEKFYQAIRRIWRFGQLNPVNIHIFLEEREGSVLKNIRRKEIQFKKMIDNMLIYMKDLTKQELEHSRRDIDEYEPEKIMELPEWIK